MKKLLLTLGTVAAVAAPVASVVACGSTPAKTDEASWDSLAKEYQAIQVMAWSNAGTNHLTKPAAGKSFTYKSATVFDDATLNDKTNRVEVDNSNQDEVNWILTEASATLEKAIAKFDVLVSKLNVDKAHPTAAEKAAYKASSEIAKLIDGDQDYAAAETAIDAALAHILAKSNVQDHDELETTDGIKVLDGVVLKDGEKDLLVNGLPLILKLAKTVSFAKSLITV